jgi:radical SAM superfamily enzyme YgiQ (UPF0313 family)
MQILLIQPWNVAYKAPVPSESLALGYLAATLRQCGLDAEILDGLILKFTPDRLATEIVDRNPTLIGISVHGQALADTSRRIAEYIRNKGCQAHICLGGVFPSVEYKRILENWLEIDSVVVGEGEYTFQQLSRHVHDKASLAGIEGLAYRSPQGDIIINSPRVRNFNLDALPFPARDTLPMVLKAVQSAQIQAGRGCSHSQCSFCTIAVFNNFKPEVARRSPELVVREIARIVKEYDCRFFHFSDDNFVDESNASSHWADSFCREINKRNIKISFRVNVRADCIEKKQMADLRKAGLWEASIGVETGSQRTLDQYCKGTTTADNLKARQILESLGIKHKPNLILFDPYISWSDLKSTLQYMSLTQIRSLKGFFRILMPYAGTPIRQRMIEDGRLTAKNFWDLGPYRFKDPHVAQLHTVLRQTHRDLTALNHCISEIKHRWIWQLSEFRQVFGTPLSASLQTLLTDMVDFNQSVESYVIKLVEELVKLVEAGKIENVDGFMQRVRFKRQVKKFNQEAENIRDRALQLAEPVLLRDRF